ncbi:MAG: PQQ-dependent dehydrogenase, methanol/ethanol family [Acidobacteria bacterium]|nr:PQQ-dependent dehydrogenase, methanol/ethanol family [Acidobacteriota bacterium]
MNPRYFGLIWALIGPFAVCTAFAQGLPVTYERLLTSKSEPGNWLMYSSSYDGWRYSGLNQIDTANVNRLRVKWLYQARTLEKFETTPLVVDGIMYLTRPENDVVALDAATGRTLWTYSHRNPPRTFNCCGNVNRGLAVSGTRLIMSTLDMHVLALDARTGRELWKTRMFDYTAAGGYAAPGAPLALKDKVIVGMAGGERGVSGFLDAYDIATGKHLWRFNTIPQPGEANFGTWAGDSWKTGGASTWNTGAFDPDLNLLYWGTSNPWPDYNGDFRKGDNLYSCSVLALDADTGKLRWYYQFTPHDLHDWDSTQIPILVDKPVAGKPRKLVVWPNRNGFFYALDRVTGEFLFAKAFVKQTWVEGFDAKGRPLLNPGNEPTPEGNVETWPGVDGAANWMSHSYSPRTGLVYVSARQERRVFTKTAERHPTTAADGPAPGAFRNFRRPRFAPEESWGEVQGIDPSTGEIKWMHKILSPPWSGVMATAGDLVFGGTLEGNVYALDARTGERLWRFPGNDRIYASPISFLANGRQHVSMPVGDVLITFTLDGQ